eukprot:2889385-Rhodomonas_salina.1
MIKQLSRTCFHLGRNTKKTRASSELAATEMPILHPLVSIFFSVPYHKSRHDATGILEPPKIHTFFGRFIQNLQAKNADKRDKD